MSGVKKISNPFPHPSKVSDEIDKEIKCLMEEKIDKRSLTFYDMLEFFDKMINDKDIERSKISGYYCTNVLMNNSDIGDDDKREIIYGMVMRVQELLN